jgi:hypothetical protein
VCNCRYARGEKVDSFSCGPKRFEIVAAKVAERLEALNSSSGSDYKMPAVEPDEPDEEATPDL